MKISVFLHGKSIAFPMLFEGIFKVKSKEILMAFFYHEIAMEKALTIHENPVKNSMAH